jgi:cellulose synthase/poly-beta-1,6-N-acetylglucosamine synthase-like glycosyltransferase
MAKRRDTLVFVPAWNEEQNLAAVLRELRTEIPEADILVVDDGSTDRTPHIAREQGAEVLSFGKNRGPRARSPPATATRPSTATRSAGESTPTGSIR